MLRSAIRKKAELFMHSQRAYGGGAEAGIKFRVRCVCSLFPSARGFLLFLSGFRALRPYTFGGGVVMPRLRLRARPARGRRRRVGHGGVELSYEGPNGLAVSAGVQSCGKRAH